MTASKKVLIAALVLVMLFMLSGCRYRLTEDSYANITADDYDGVMKEDYDMLRDELGMSESKQSVFNSGKSFQKNENPFPEEDITDIEEPDTEPDDEDDTSDEPAATTTTPSTSTPSTVVSRPSTTTTTDSRITVKLNANGGTTTTPQVMVTAGQTYGFLPTPTRDKYDFQGWYTAKEKGKQVTSTTKVTNKSNHTLYAHWTKVSDRQYTVTLNVNGGNGKNKTIKLKNKQKYKSLPTPKRDGYAFLGWFTKESGGTEVKNGDKFTEAANITLYAQWEKALDYWSEKLADANEDISESDLRNYYIEFEKSDKVKTTGDSKLYMFSGNNVLSDELSGDENVDESIYSLINALDEDDKPDLVIKCISDSSDADSAQQEMEDRFPSAEVIVISNDAAEGNSKEKLFYSIWLSASVYDDFGISNSDLEKASSELGVSID